ncbi:hypothetical protein NT2_05_02020 [Caenibius tardaugens NBRC 16725]|uniref:Endonuclease/exonuclease/phosphatase domain-containing protein n=1 Tax=Caenibius tardaugens NBRC 16725 TaxID=1219035 RepID=U2YLK7_9SPHN|nr:endonuclease/exonuclease/phosphatase family protein [Caenibius tardaugens]AZI36629.1 endonuclease [Caenibius tardaugens NBRC 16725]GAD49282.1 hypothetical protein NT2_05_02020 [Caenibius tardaugens NBRC 16725]
MPHSGKTFAALFLFALLGTSACPAPAYETFSPAPVAVDGTLSVMTYNVKGLPWPVAWRRSDALDKIATRLGAMHQQGIAPHIVLLQEAFVPAARAIGAKAGYPYVVSGPDADDTNPSQMPGPAARFADRAHWWKGETEGKYVGSGLEILSDYPVVAVHRMAFPSYACAGFDCLANKGALMVTLSVPGISHPVDVITTHLNSRGASGVGSARSDEAYQMQVAALSSFVRKRHDPTHLLIAGGDFNVGKAKVRRAALLDAVAHKWSPGLPVNDALHADLAAGGRLPEDARLSFQRAKDWQFYGGGEVPFRVASIEVPFGREKGGGMLSDHVGYTARYRLDAPRLPSVRGGNGVTTPG